MSKHLLPISAPYGDSMKYIRLDTSSTISSSMITEHNRELYIGIYMDDSIFRILKMNMFTKEILILANIPKVSIGNAQPGCILVDDDYIYIKRISTNYIYRYDIHTSEIITFNYSQYGATSRGKMYWFDKHKICYITNNGLMLFDTLSKSYSIELLTKTSIGTVEDFTIGNKLILSVRDSSTTNMINIYDMVTKEYSTLKTTNTTIGVVCHDGDHTFYIAQNNILTVYDEDTKTIVETISVPWSGTKSIVYDDGFLYVSINNNANIFIYDLKNKIYRRVYLPWTIPSVGNPVRPMTFEGFYFLPYITLGVMNLKNDAKYKLGYKHNQNSIIYNNTNKSKFEYDTKCIAFEDSFVTIKDTDIIIPLSPDTNNGIIKRAKVSKSNYNKLKSVAIIKNQMVVPDIERNDFSND